MDRDEARKHVTFDDDNLVSKPDLEKIGAREAILFFEHTGRLWQVKTYYTIKDIIEAEALVEEMSKDHRFQTPTSRVGFEVTQDEDGYITLYIRYTEINMKREYIHHQIALGRASQEEDDKRRSEELVKQMEEEEDIPTGPLIF